MPGAPLGDQAAQRGRVLVGEPAVGGVHRRLLDGPRREEALHHRLGLLGRAPAPHLVDLGEVLLGVRGRAARPGTGARSP